MRSLLYAPSNLPASGGAPQAGVSGMSFPFGSAAYGGAAGGFGGAPSTGGFAAQPATTTAAFDGHALQQGPSETVSRRAEMEARPRR